MKNKYLIPLIALITFGIITSLFLVAQLSEKSQQSSQEKHEVVKEIPVKLIIPKLNINTTIESVGHDDKGAMDVPKEPQNVAWYNLGFRPGENGNAVISGHFDDINGEPAVFYNLITLEPGDEIKIVDAKNKETNYVVTEVKTFPYKDFPIKEVFGGHDSPRLNLITCWGKWDEAQKTYLERVVVYSEPAN